MIKRLTLRMFVAGSLVFVAVAGASAEVQLRADATVLDPDLIMYSWPYPIISPNGEWVAYISRGYVCVSSLENGEPRKLFEVPESWTHFLALPENAEADGDFGALARSLSHDEYGLMLKKIKKTIFGLQWTRENDAIVFGVQSHDTVASTTRSDVYLAPLQGEVKRIAHSESPLTGRGIGGDFQLTNDRRYLVMGSEWGKSLIWDVENDRPRATCFLNLTPSTTSDRWIAVEKDTRQLVITDRDFSVVKRFNEIIAPNEYGYKMHWSPNERYVICQTQIGMDHYSNWEGFRLDLQTNERRVLSGDYMGEKIVFTGNEGEFLRVGVDGKQGMMSGLIEVGTYFQIVPTGDGEPVNLWQLQVDPATQKDVRLGSQPPVTYSPDFSLFTIGLPRQTGHYGVIYHLLDHNRKLWRLSREDTTEYMSPYEVVGFAKNGKMIVGYDRHQLFAVPVTAIQTDENKVTQGE